MSGYDENPFGEPMVDNPFAVRLLQPEEMDYDIANKLYIVPNIKWKLFIHM